MCRALLTLALLLPATAAVAGPWPRAEGEVFLSFGGNVALIGEAARPVHYDPTIYLEYGYSERLTLGMDGFTADRGDAGSVFGFARYALVLPDSTDAVAVGFGLGFTRLPDGTQEGTARVTGHWGRGIEDGWLAVDAELTFGAASESTQGKIDGTWGYRYAPDWTTLLQFQVGVGLAGDVYTKVTPSLIWNATDHVQLRGGVVQALSGDYGTGLTLETWIRF